MIDVVIAEIDVRRVALKEEVDVMRAELKEKMDKDLGEGSYDEIAIQERADQMILQLKADYPEKVVEEAKFEIKRYCDYRIIVGEKAINFRLACAGNSKQVVEYEAKWAKGCCGYYDRVLVVDGQVWLIGWNFGHTNK